MKPQPKFIPSGHNPSHSSNSSMGPTLHDSKSLSYLKTCLEEPKKFRETTFYPVTSKNSNLEFLRYTVNINRSPNQKSSPQIFPQPKLKLNRKLTQELPIAVVNDQKQKPNSLWRFETKQLGSPKKSTNPQKKLDKLTPSKFNEESIRSEKMGSSDQKNITTITERNQVKLKSTQNLATKKTYTPKAIKMVGSNKESKQGKFMNSYSSIDLLKQDHANSPTSESISSRMGQSKVKESFLNNFEKIKYLGEGKFGQVHLVRHRDTGALFALKQIKKDSIIKNNMEEQLLMEIKMQSFFNHPNILKLYGFFDDEENIFLILQYMEEGTLYSQLRKQKTLKQSEASRKLRDILEGVSYLHSMTVAHRDLKPQNIVLSNDVCKICDLGWAAVCEDRRKTLCGTIDYASPELLQGKDYGIAIDLWCLGVLCYELMVGKAPFYHISRKQTMRKIIKADCSDINIPANVPGETCDFIGRLLKRNPEERMSADEALVHPLIMKYRDEELEDFRMANKKSN